jgi:hypothetical protein
LFELRRIKQDGVDDSDYIHALTYVDLDSEQFIDILPSDVERLRSLTAALAYIVEERAVPPADHAPKRRADEAPQGQYQIQRSRGCC